MSRLRVGSVPYLNAKPLVAWLHAADGPTDVELVYDVPSQLAQGLRRGELDVAMVSTFELFRNHRLVVVPGISISADGPVRSVRLLSSVPPEQIKSVALDTSSLTSVNLVRVILKERYGLAPVYCHRPPDLDGMLNEADACVIIGDLRLFGLPARYVLDLGEEWKQLTGLPFVYAAWLAREDADVARAAEVLTRARDYGVSRLEGLTVEWSERMGLPEHDVRDYFLNVMQYDLDAAKQSALQAFRDRCIRHGLAEAGPPIRFARPGGGGLNRVIRERTLPGGLILRLVRGDITEERVDAIVNAANMHLAHGGGVAGQIVRRGGPSIQRESDALAPVATGRAAITGAGELPCRFVIHAVGPVWGTGEEDCLLQSALWSSLDLAAEKGLASVSVPAISSGIFGFPRDRCARVLLDAALSWLAPRQGGPVREVRFCLYDAATAEEFEHVWAAREGAPGGWTDG